MLQQLLSNWDRKSKDDISHIYRQFCHAEHFSDELISLLSSAQCVTGATWLLKHHFDKGHCPSEEQAGQLYGQLASLNDWQSKLHFLQMMEVLPVKHADIKSLDLFLRSGLSDGNKFVRAWSYNGLFLLARFAPSYRTEVMSFLNMAMRDESPSVKTRIRKLVKKGF